MLKVYAYENSCGDKGIIIAEKKEKAEAVIQYLQKAEIIVEVLENV